jgi:hypothetical protein
VVPHYESAILFAGSHERLAVPQNQGGIIRRFSPTYQILAFPAKFDPFQVHGFFDQRLYAIKIDSPHSLSLLYLGFPLKHCIPNPVNRVQECSEETKVMVETVLPVAERVAAYELTLDRAPTTSIISYMNSAVRCSASMVHVAEASSFIGTCLVSQCP